MNFKINFAHKVAVVGLTMGSLFVSSCNDELLNPAPLTTFSEATVFNTPERILQQVRGIYDAIKSGQYYGGRFLVYHDIRGEEFLNETTNGVTGFSTWNHTIVSSTNEVNNLWNAVYYAINSANLFIDGLEQNRAVLNNETLANNYIAEARFVRALCYHSLLTIYARPFTDGNGSKPGVPLRLLPEKGPANNDLARATVAEVYNQILADLNFAEQNLPANYSTPYLNTTRAHKNSAIALKTRVYLAMGRYQDVLTEAAKIVPATAPFKASSGVAHELQADISKVFSTPYTTTESIFSMPMTDLDLPGTQNGLGSYYNPGPRGIGDFSLNPAGIVGNAFFKDADKRRAWIFRASAAAKPYLNKFPAGPQHLDYVPVIRYAEVLLNASEAAARTGNKDRALALLNAVHGRSDAATVFNAASFATDADLVNAILLERRIELLGEGFRTQDLVRLLLPYPGKSNVATVNPSQSEYIWPIPQGELNVNKLAVQNP
jgi:hypothetical protein